MRPILETLPTLGETDAPNTAGAETTGPAGQFEPEAILKALGTRHCDRPARAVPRTGDGAPRTGDGARTVRRPFSAEVLPRRGETRLDRQKDRDTVTTAIQSFDRPAPIAEAASAADEEIRKIRAEAEERCVSAVEKARAQERDIAREALEAEKTRWAEETAEALSTQLDQAFVDLHNRLSDTIAAALGPVMEEAVRARAVDRFSSSLERLMGRQGSAEPITIKGPKQLLDALAEVRAGDTAGLKLVAADESELVASVNDTTLRTTIKAWAAALAAATGSRHGQR